MKSRLPAAALTITAALFFAGLPVAHAAVVTYIDLFNNLQNVPAENQTVTNSISASGAIGTNRTFTVSSVGNEESIPNRLRVATNAGPRLILTTDPGTTATFEVTWGGLNGTSGLGGIDFTGGFGTNFSLIGSTFNFSLLSSTHTNAYTWRFTDTSSNVAEFAQALPIRSGTNPAILYSISLASFNNSSLVNWSAINFISLSGGGIDDLDVTITGPAYVTAAPIPEPGTWAAAGLLLLTAVYIRWRRSRGAAPQEEAPAAA